MYLQHVNDFRVEVYVSAAVQFSFLHVFMIYSLAN